VIDRMRGSRGYGNQGLKYLEAALARAKLKP
jgi:hypothetical protein